MPTELKAELETRRSELAQVVVSFWNSPRPTKKLQAAADKALAEIERINKLIG